MIHPTWVHRRRARRSAEAGKQYFPGLKGLRFGGAEISNIHSNFIINANKASSSDIQELIEYIQKRVFDAYGILLETEVKKCGF